MAEPETVDAVVISAGSSGSVFAGRLAERGDLSIAVIEAGRSRWPKITAIPPAVFHTMGKPRYDWCYNSEPDPSRAACVDQREAQRPQDGPVGTTQSQTRYFRNRVQLSQERPTGCVRETASFATKPNC